MEVQVLKNQGKSSRTIDNGPQEMEVDRVGVMHSNELSIRPVNPRMCRLRLNFLLNHESRPQGHRKLFLAFLMLLHRAILDISEEHEKRVSDQEF